MLDLLHGIRRAKNDRLRWNVEVALYGMFHSCSRPPISKISFGGLDSICACSEPKLLACDGRWNNELPGIDLFYVEENNGIEAETFGWFKAVETEAEGGEISEKRKMFSHRE